MLTVETTKQDRKGRAIKTRRRLSQQDIAAWLDRSVYLVAGLETGRVRLTPANAEMITHQTFVSTDWLMGNDPLKPITDMYLEPYTQRTFDLRQAELRLRSEKGELDYWRIQSGFSHSVALLAAVLAEAYKKGHFDLYSMKVNAELRELFWQIVPDGIDRNGIVGSFMKGKRTKELSTRPDLEPILDAWGAVFTKQPKPSAPRSQAPRASH